jgi:hypothetical protein
VAVGRVEEEGGGGNDIALSTSRRLSKIMEIFGNRIEFYLFFLLNLEYQDIKGLEKSSLSRGGHKKRH